MYQCLGCGGNVENTAGQCFCGKTTTDHKGRVSGENYVKINGQVFTEKSKVRTCPHCGWTGLVVPRINHGCPDHGIWYKNSEDTNKSMEDTHDGTDTNNNQRAEGWDEVLKPDSTSSRKKNRRNKERKAVCRPNSKRPNRNR